VHVIGAAQDAVVLIDDLAENGLDADDEQ